MLLRYFGLLRVLNDVAGAIANTANPPLISVHLRCHAAAFRKGGTFDACGTHFKTQHAIAPFSKGGKLAPLNKKRLFGGFLGTQKKAAASRANDLRGSPTTLLRHRLHIRRSRRYLIARATWNRRTQVRERVIELAILDQDTIGVG